MMLEIRAESSCIHLIVMLVLIATAAALLSCSEITALVGAMQKRRTAQMKN
jgi:hypothetical protein